MQYDIYRENSSTVVNFMTGTPYIIYQDGTDANNLAKFNL